MYKAINGWTKRKMLAIVNKRKHTRACMGTDGGCFYGLDDGNKCAIGLFLPPRHPARDSSMAVTELLIEYPELQKSLPLNHRGLCEFQSVHDGEATDGYKEFEGNAKAAMIAFIKKNVK